MKKVKGAKKLNNKGFSMVEIIIVIAIIAILATVLAPQYFKHLENARKTTDLDNYRNIVSALQVEAATTSIADGSIKFEGGNAKDVNDNIKSLLSSVGINLDNVTMKSSDYKSCTITFKTTDGVISFTVDNEELAKALGIGKTPSGS